MYSVMNMYKQNGGEFGSKLVASILSWNSIVRGIRCVHTRPTTHGWPPQIGLTTPPQLCVQIGGCGATVNVINYPWWSLYT